MHTGWAAAEMDARTKQLSLQGSTMRPSLPVRMPPAWAQCQSPPGHEGGTELPPHAAQQRAQLALWEDIM